MPKWVLFFVAALFLGAVAAPVLAQPAPKPKTFEELKREGDDAMDAYRFDEALAAYTAAHELRQEPALLYNIGRAHEARSDYPAALEFLERFDRDASPELKRRAQGYEDLLRDVRGRVATLDVETSAAGARILLRDKQIGTSPLSAPVRVNAGAAVLEVVAEGYETFRREITLEGGKATKIKADLVRKDQSGTLRVVASMPGAKVTIDGKLAGVTPVELKVAPGTHKVLVTHERAEDSSTSAVVATGKRTELKIDLVEVTPVEETWWLWTSVAAVAVTAGVVITAAVLIEREPSKGTIDPGLLRTNRFFSGFRF